MPCQFGPHTYTVISMASPWLSINLELKLALALRTGDWLARSNDLCRFVAKDPSQTGPIHWSPIFNIPRLKHHFKWMMRLRFIPPSCIIATTYLNSTIGTVCPSSMNHTLHQYVETTNTTYSDCFFLHVFVHLSCAASNRLATQFYQREYTLQALQTHIYCSMTPRKLFSILPSI